MFQEESAFDLLKSQRDSGIFLSGHFVYFLQTIFI